MQEHDAGQFAELAGRCHRALDVLHSLCYFAEETESELTGLGLRAGRMCYFASRAAPMGPVGPGTVAATFYNFNPELVAKHIPQAWTIAAPEAIIAARYRAAGAALRHTLGERADDPAIAEAAELAAEATRGASPEGRPLYAAHAELEWSDEPLLRLYHAITLLREFRGDGHVAALVGAGLDGLSALLTHTATGQGFTESGAKSTRGWSDAQWATAVRTLHARGLTDAEGALTEDGSAARQRVEDATNMAATGPWMHLGAERADRLREICKELSKHAIAAGAFPAGLFAQR